MRERGMRARLLLPAPPAMSGATRFDHAGAPEGYHRRRVIDGHGWSIIERPGPTPLDVVREQRDGLARLQEKLLATIRRLEADNASLRSQLERYLHYPSIEEQEDELADAARLEHKRGIVFHRMP